MELYEQVVSLELAQRLKTLNVKQESFFYWQKSEYKILINEDGSKEIEEYRTSLCMPPYFDLSTSVGYWSAFSVAELGQMLPDYIQSTTASGNDKTFHFSKCEKEFYVGIENHNRTIVPVFYDKNEANARAKMLIYLIENNLIKAE